MDDKKSIRRSFYLKRKKKYHEVSDNFFFFLKKNLEPRIKNKKKNISLYYPTSYELNILKIFEIKFFKRFNFLLPVIEDKNVMNFYPWKTNDILYLNKFGIPEPMKSKKIIPDVILVPLLAFDKNKNRLGYGKGFYDKYLNKYVRKNKKILTIGVAFSFQKHHKLPTNDYDFTLDFIITDKGEI